MTVFTEIWNLLKVVIVNYRQMPTPEGKRQETKMTYFFKVCGFLH